ncbi:MAG: hypothetical protein SO103_06550 [Erysipelotrichaceae bacterium]|nr:hypothetical protein [Erysipelotrichaceae bacterium]
MNIKTERLRIVDLDISMANDIYLLSKDDDMKKYLSDEVLIVKMKLEKLLCL